MLTPSLRILVVDPLHAHRFFIEKMLNWFGYYRVAPIATMDEVLGIIDGEAGYIDVLIINADLAANSGLDVNDLCREYPAVGHAIVYHGGIRALFRSAGEVGRVTHVSGFPDVELIRRFMRMVELSEEPYLEKHAPPYLQRMYH